MKMTVPYSNVIVTNKSESKRSILNKKLSYKYSAKEKKLCFTKKDESECENEKQKDANNEVAYDVTNYLNVSNVWERGRENPDVKCEIACMANEDNDYFSDVLDTLNEYQDRHGQRLSIKNIREAVRRVMNEEVEEMERYINNITCDTPFQSPGTKSVQKKDASWSLKRRLAAGVQAEMVKNFKGCSIQSDEQVDDISDPKEQLDARNWLRNDSFEEVDVLNNSEFLVVDGSDPKSDPNVATHTINRISSTDTTNGILTPKIYPMFIKPAIHAVVQPTKTKSRASFGSLVVF